MILGIPPRGHPDVPARWPAPPAAVGAFRFRNFLVVILQPQLREGSRISPVMSLAISLISPAGLHRKQIRFQNPPPLPAGGGGAVEAGAAPVPVPVPVPDVPALVPAVVVNRHVNQIDPELAAIEAGF